MQQKVIYGQFHCSEFVQKKKRERKKVANLKGKKKVIEDMAMKEREMAMKGREFEVNTL